MSCPTSMVPGLDDSSKLKSPALGAKINQIFPAQGNPKTGDIEYRESNTASVLNELSRRPGELGHMSRYLKGLGVQHSLRSKKAKRDQDGISLNLVSYMEYM